MVREYPYPVTGVDRIDAEHREIGEVIVRVHRAASDGDTYTLGPLMTRLEQVVADHFASEERLMATIKYPQADRHRAAHAEYLERLSARAAELREKGFTPELLSFFVNLERWFRSHVNAEDKHLAAALGAARARA